MKLKKIRNALLVVLTLALVSASAVAVTWAYFQGQDFGNRTNTFTNEDIAAELTEEDFDGAKPQNDPDYDENYVPANHVKPNGSSYSASTDDGLGMNIALSYNYETNIPKNPSITNISEKPDTDETAATDPQEWVAMTVRYYILDNNTRYYFDGYKEFSDAIATVKHDSNSTSVDGFNIGETGATWAPKATPGQESTAHDGVTFYYNSLVDNWTTTATIFDDVVINSQAKYTTNVIVPDSASTAPDSNNKGKFKFTGLSQISNDGNYSLTGTVGGTTIYLDTLPEFHIELKGYAVQGEFYGSGGTTKKTALDNDIKDALNALIEADKASAVLGY